MAEKYFANAFIPSSRVLMVPSSLGIAGVIAIESLPFDESVLYIGSTVIRCPSRILPMPS